MPAHQLPPFLTSIRRRENAPPRSAGHPHDLPLLEGLPLDLRAPVTMFVGENGSGKSSLIEGIADLCDLPIGGGGRGETPDIRAPEEAAPLSAAIRIAWRARPKDLWFFRAEFHATFANLLEDRARDPDFTGDPFARFGGRSLHERSHGEAFLTLMTHRFQRGLFLLDEPESALSPQRQLALGALILDRVAAGSQFLIATHSPILLTLPGADLVNLNDAGLPRIASQKTDHVSLTRALLERPDRYWKHFRDAPEEDGDQEPPDVR